MVQVEGDRNYVAPALKTAPVFGGIAGIMAGDPAADLAGEPISDTVGSTLPSSLTSKARDNASEVQDMYRRSSRPAGRANPASWPRMRASRIYSRVGMDSSPAAPVGAVAAMPTLVRGNTALLRALTEAMVVVRVVVPPAR